MLLPREFKKRLVAIDSDYVPQWSNGFRNSGGDRTGSTADIEHGNTRPQQLGKTAMVLLQSSPAKYSRIGPM